MMSATGGDDEKTFEAVRSRLRARIVSAEMVAQSGSDKLMLVTRPFSPKARIGYVVDRAQTMAFVSTGSLDKWSASADAVHASAIENLDALSRDVEIQPHAPHPGSGLYAAIQGPEGYAAALLLAPQFMARMGEELGPEHFVGAPARDLLLAWSVDCSIKRKLAARVAFYALSGPYGLTDELFVWSADGVRPANPDELADHGRS
jgi:uncharacterized protein YtpQ (UPF0354 family)